jgi:hypothetical protein
LLLPCGVAAGGGSDACCPPLAAWPCMPAGVVTGPVRRQTQRPAGQDSSALQRQVHVVPARTGPVPAASGAGAVAAAASSAVAGCLLCTRIAGETTACNWQCSCNMPVAVLTDQDPCGRLCEQARGKFTPLPGAKIVADRSLANLCCIGLCSCTLYCTPYCCTFVLCCSYVHISGCSRGPCAASCTTWHAWCQGSNSSSSSSSSSRICRAQLQACRSRSCSS